MLPRQFTLQKLVAPARCGAGLQPCKHSSGMSDNATLSDAEGVIMIILIVQVQVKPEGVAAFEAATEDNAVNSRLEPGVVRFDVLRQQQDATRFALVEVYRDETAVAAHKTTAHYLRWRDAVADLLADPRVGVTYSNVSPADDEW
jgi:(4S)-4-hydroxy-5-phosphonooxypentane-2,3-dione isomerase